MWKNRSLWIVVICLIVALPVMAQDDETEETVEPTPIAVDYDCSLRGVNLQVDTWYNDYLAARGEFEVTQALVAAEEFSDNLSDLYTACTAETSTDPEEVVEQTGIGTFDAPFIIQAPGVVGDTSLDITQSILPADEVLIESGVTSENFIPEGEEFLLLTITLSCRDGSTVGCGVTPDSFRVIGDRGTFYMPEISVAQIDDYFPNSRRVSGGDERSGVLPFLVNEDDTSLKLVYFPNGDALQPDGAFTAYFDATGAANSFEVRSTTPELLIRQRPVNGAPIGVLRDEQVGTATGRNPDTSWIFIEAPEGTGWVSAEFLTSDSELESLSVVDVEE